MNGQLVGWNEAYAICGARIAVLGCKPDGKTANFRTPLKKNLMTLWTKKDAKADAKLRGLKLNDKTIVR